MIAEFPHIEPNYIIEMFEKNKSNIELTVEELKKLPKASPAMGPVALEEEEVLNNMEPAKVTPLLKKLRQDRLVQEFPEAPPNLVENVLKECNFQYNESKNQLAFVFGPPREIKVKGAHAL